MRRITTAVLFSALVLAGLAEAKSIYSTECAAICADPDTTKDLVLSPDPRSLTAEGGFTSVWQDCHDDAEHPRFETCREWCAARDRGEQLIRTQGLIGSFLDARVYNDLWKAWGEEGRPEHFDERIIDRYGFQPSPFHNPYPRVDKGEPMVSADGGSGQLPMGFIQTRNTEEPDKGKYNGGIGFTCLLCHAGRIGEESRIGIGNTTFDLEVFSVDLGKAGGTPIPLPYPHNETRGTVNAVSDFEFLMIVRDYDTLDNTPFVKTLPAHPSPGDQDPPAWHNTGSRPRVYMDGGVSSDNTRALMQFLTASISTSPCTGSKPEDVSGCGAWIKKQEADFEDVRVYIDSIEPPSYPRTIAATKDQGEDYFHALSLFPEGDPQRIGNGSCSSCHGVYSEKYASLLPGANSRLLGIAGQIVPRDVVGTDPARVDALASELRWGWGTLWFAYADNTAPDPLSEVLNDFNSSKTNFVAGGRQPGRCGWVAVDDQGNVDAKLVGYAAPALHGLWATAPYFHNGSVPTVWHVLNPEERPTVWRRPLRNTVVDYEDKGFDVGFDAYDFDKLGWKFDTACEGTPLVDCPLADPVAGAVLNVPGQATWPANQSPRPVTQSDVERRKFYDTTRYGKSNAGHAYPGIVNMQPAVRDAIIEYLKTL